MTQAVTLAKNITKNPDLYRCISCGVVSVVEDHAPNCPAALTPS